MERNDAVGSFSIQVKNYTSDMYLSQAIKYCSKQRDHVVQRTNCGGTISVLMMVGKGSVIVKKKGNAVGRYPSMMLMLDEWPNDIFLILNNFPGVDNDVKTLLAQLSSASNLHAAVTGSLGDVISCAQDSARKEKRRIYVQSSMAKLDLSSTSLPPPPDDIGENLFADLQGEGLQVSALVCGGLSRGVLIVYT